MRHTHQFHVPHSVAVACVLWIPASAHSHSCRIDSRSSRLLEEKTRALSLLRWVVFAVRVRPLTVSELTEAQHCSRQDVSPLYTRRLMHGLGFQIWPCCHDMLRGHNPKAKTDLPSDLPKLGHLKYWQIEVRTDTAGIRHGALFSNRCLPRKTKRASSS